MVSVIEKRRVRGWVVKKKFLGLDPGYKFVTFMDAEGKYPFRNNIGLTFVHPEDYAYCIDNQSITYVMTVDALCVYPYFESAEFEMYFCKLGIEDNGNWYSDKILIRDDL